ncbi:MAG: D-lyxose/D-mannose family sugar isomerase [Spirochaetales bacterium]|nr:D-lyxose/D-mannose family sugar isomerase [Spirochaetales bacterium]
MARSQINDIIIKAQQFFARHSFALPPWAFWSPDDWKGQYKTCAEVVDNMLGWDVTPFSSDDFYARGLLAFTLRNGNPLKDRKPYGEKILIVEENQETPFHFHWSKMEDIINRGGGNLIIELYSSTENEEFSDQPPVVRVDGVSREVEPGGTVALSPGESICLYQGLYHRFYGEPGKGKVLVGEVSSVNDDNEDNRWFENLGRFPGIEEDREPLHLLAVDYPRYM